METKEQIYQVLKTIIVDLFEVEESEITLEANLNDELDLDSIDAVDMLVNLQEISGTKVEPEVFKNVRTVNDIVEAVYQVLQK